MESPPNRSERPIGSVSSFELPYDFDTAAAWRGIASLAFVLIVALVALLGAATLTGRLVAAFQLALALGIAAVIAAKLRRLTSFGAKGTVSRTEVIAGPVSVYGIPLRVPVGTFSVRSFQGVRVIRRLGKRRGVLCDLADVFLVGSGDIPDIQIFAGPARDGLQIAEALEATLSLPVVTMERPGTRRFDFSL